MQKILYGSMSMKMINLIESNLNFVLRKLNLNARITCIRYHFEKIIDIGINPCASIPDHVRDLALKEIEELQNKSKK